MAETHPSARAANDDDQARQDRARDARDQEVNLAGRDQDERNQRAADAEEQRRQNAEQRDARRDRDAANPDQAADLAQQDAD